MKGFRAVIVGGAATALAVAGVVTAQLASAQVAPAQGGQEVTETIEVSGVFDGENQRFFGGGDLGDGGQNEGQDPLFRLADGATLTNVIIGAPAADGVHCDGSCNLTNVSWEDVGEDAATFRGTNATVLVDGGSAAAAEDKVFQDNRGAGGSVTITNFEAADFGTFYRSCGNCSTQAERNSVISNVTATDGNVMAGININYGDTVQLSGLTLNGDIGVCDLYEGNDTGDEPEQVGEGPDGTNCILN